MSKLTPLIALAVSACSAAPPRARVVEPHPRPARTLDATAIAEPPVGPLPPAEGSRVLFAVTGFGSARTSIPLAEVAREYCAGKLPVVSEVRTLADERFDCRAPAREVATLRDLLPEAGTTLAITDLAHLTPQWKALAVDDVAFFERPAGYPLVLATGGARPDFTPRLTHLVTTGVTAITRRLGAAVDVHGIEWLTANLRPHFATAHYVHVSNEVSFTPDCEYPVEGVFKFCTKEPHFEALRALRANLVELTGNHNRDFGDEPFRATLAWYRAHGMRTFGGGNTAREAAEPLLVPLADGKQLGIVGFNETCPLGECARGDAPGANAYAPKKARAAIEALRARGADVVLVTMQWQEHDFPAPTKTQGPQARALIDAGADIVLGSQAHQLQVIEFHAGKPIFYGLGNLLFDQIHRLGVRQAYFLHHYFFDGRLVQSVPVFTWMSDARQPSLATPAQAAEMRAIVMHEALLYEARAWFPALLFPWR